MSLDTKTIANRLQTEPRILRRFLRDPKSTFTAVGSGSRYVFTETDIPELERRFSDWMGNRPAATRPATPAILRQCDEAAAQRLKDEAVWADEDRDRGGPLVMADIRDPRVRKAVQSKARLWDARLEERLMAAGLHISQMPDRRVAV